MSFHIGQKVVCVDDAIHREWPSNWLCPGDVSGLTRNMIYTVRWVGVYRKPNGALIDGLRVAEIMRGGPDTPYSTCRFRPLEEKPDSIEIFREIARGVSDGKPVVEDAEYRLPTPEKVRA